MQEKFKILKISHVSGDKTFYLRYIYLGLYQCKDGFKLQVYTFSFQKIRYDLD